MVSIDARFPATLPATPAAAGWWHRPRWLLLPLALPACIVVGLAVGTLINLALTGTLGGEAGGGVLAPSAVAADHSALVAPEVCQRMHQLVAPACSLKQRDHDAPEIRRCVPADLKYTQWTPSGCGGT